MTADMVNNPPHYTSDPSGVECITITRHRNFNVGNAIKYLWRAGLKGDGSTAKQIEDLEKAVFYINDEIARISTSLQEERMSRLDRPDAVHHSADSLARPGGDSESTPDRISRVGGSGDE